MVVISRPQGQNFTFADLEGDLPLKTIGILVKVLLDDFAVGRREGLRRQ